MVFKLLQYGFHNLDIFGNVFEIKFNSKWTKSLCKKILNLPKKFLFRWNLGKVAKVTGAVVFG